MIGTMELSDFSSQLGQKFQLPVSPSVVFDIELIEVNELGSGADDDTCSLRERPFSLVFRGPEEAPLAQGTHTIENESIGTVEIFLVPIGPDKAGLCYEAVFN